MEENVLKLIYLENLTQGSYKNLSFVEIFGIGGNQIEIVK